MKEALSFLWMLLPAIIAICILIVGIYRIRCHTKIMNNIKKDMGYIERKR